MHHCESWCLCRYINHELWRIRRFQFSVQLYDQFRRLHLAAISVRSECMPHICDRPTTPNFRHISAANQQDKQHCAFPVLCQFVYLVNYMRFQTPTDYAIQTKHKALQYNMHSIPKCMQRKRRKLDDDNGNGDNGKPIDSCLLCAVAVGLTCSTNSTQNSCGTNVYTTLYNT